jgi:hypothetical protein
MLPRARKVATVSSELLLGTVSRGAVLANSHNELVLLTGPLLEKGFPNKTITYIVQSEISEIMRHWAIRYQIANSTVIQPNTCSKCLSVL